MNDPRRCSTCGQPLATDAPGGLCPGCLFQRGLDSQTLDPAVTASPGRPAEPLDPAELAPFFPQLEILSCLGRGGMGVVYKARQKSLDRLVALKILAPEREQDPAFSERFATEALALARLNHPHIVTIYDFGQAGRYFYLLMEFVDGVNLRQLQQSRRLEPREALAIVPPICEALQFAHDQGIVHRDIKPANLLLDKQGRVKIADFGIARMLGERSSSASEQAAGTPGYAAPEQISQPRLADHRADIYSLGVVLYEMLTGELPARRIEAPSRKVHIDVRLDEIVLRALERNPDLRYSQVSLIKTQIDQITTDAAAAAERESAQARPAATGIDLNSWTIWGVPIVGVREGRALPWPRGVALFATICAIVAMLCALVGVAVSGHRLGDVNLLIVVPILYASLFGTAIIVRRALKTPLERLRPLPAAPLLATNPPPEWALRLASRSVAARRGWRLGLTLAGICLTGCFVAPQHHVTEFPGTNRWRSVLTAGWPTPWLNQIQEFNPMQRWDEFHPWTLSLWCGVFACGMWMAFWRCAVAEGLAGSQLAPDDRVFAPRLRTNSAGQPLIDWRHVWWLCGGLIGSVATACGVTIVGMSAILNASPLLPSMTAMVMPLLFIGFIRILRWSVHQDKKVSGTLF